MVSRSIEKMNAAKEEILLELKQLNFGKSFKIIKNF